MNLSELTAKIREIHERAKRVGEGRAAGAGAGAGAEGDADDEADLEVYEALGVAAEELRVVEEALHQQNNAIRDLRWALDEERGRYRDLFEHAPDAYLVTDALGVVREANQGAAELLNIRPKFLVGKPLVLFVAEEARAAFRSELNRLATKTGVGRYEFRMCPRDEPAFDAEVTAVAVATDGGRGIGLRWAVRDVTGRRQIEERLRLLNQDLERLVRERTAELDEEYRERERILIEAHSAAAILAPQFLDLIDNLNAIIWTADAESGRFTFVSRGAEAILGYPASSWISDPGFWAGRIHPDDRGWVLEDRTQRLRAGRDFEAEYRLVAADGRHVWFREAVRVVSDDPGGRPRELRGLMVNISRRKKVERQLYAHRNELSERLEDLAYLQELSGRLSGTLELQPILEEILDGAMSVQGAPKGVLRLYDRDRRELVVAAATGLPERCLEFIARGPIGVGACGVAYATGRPVIVADVRGEGDEYDREAGELGEYRAAFSVPFRNRAGELLGTIATYFDEPHHPPPRQVRLVEVFATQAADFIENASQLREAREAARSRDVFLTVLAHEMRNPLQAIHAALAPLARLEDPEHAAARDIIRRQAGRLDRLIADLLDSSRIADGKLPLHRVPTDLREPLRRAIEATRGDVSGRGHQLRAEIPDEPLRAEIDAARMEQVFVNLITNAAKYTPPGGRIDVSMESQGDEIVVRVRDNGMGIDPDGLARIFGMFDRGHPTAPASMEGLGVGLWLVRSLVELHGGRFSARSQGAGHGSEFLISLPAPPAPPDDSSAAEETADPRSDQYSRA